MRSEMISVSTTEITLDYVSEQHHISPKNALGRGKKMKSRKRRPEIWRCRCGADGVVKIVGVDGKYRIYCLDCL